MIEIQKNKKDNSVLKEISLKINFLKMNLKKIAAFLIM